MGRRKVSDEALIEAILLTPTLEEAARRANIAERTLYYRLQNPEFKRKYADRRRALVDTAMARLEKSLARAIHTLNKNMSCGRPSDENTAAKAVIDYVRWAQENGEIVQRLEELEETISKAID